MSAINLTEIQLLSQFRKRLTDLNLNEEWSCDYNLIRWIRARDLDLDAAENMLRASIKWRCENNIDQILSWDPTPEYRFQYPYHIGSTRDNGLFLILLPGRTSMKEAAQTAESREYMQKYLNRIFAEIALALRDRKDSGGIPITQIVIIADFSGFSYTSVLSVAVFQLIKDFVSTFDANEPERLKIAYIINGNAKRYYKNSTSRFFSFLLSLLKPVLARKTLAKLTAVNPNPNICKQVLLEIISEEELPILYGGKERNSLVNRFLT